MKSWTQREAHIDLVLDHCRSRVAGRDRAAMEDFIRSFYRKAAPEDVIARPPETLCGIAFSMWNFAAERAPGAPRLRVFNPTLEEDGWQSSHTAVQMVNDDMPFLVDSVTNNLALSGIEVHFVCHPVMRVARDAEGRRQGAMAAEGDVGADPGNGLRESLIHMEIDRKTAPEVLDRIATELTTILADVRIAVGDWQAMIEAIRGAAAELEAAGAATAASADRMAEARIFLDWLADDRFTFLGYRRYSHRPREGVAELGLGLLRDPARHVFRTDHQMVAVSPEVRDFMAGPEPLIVTKANLRSTVHRPVHLDYVGVKRYDADGAAIGEHRFIGLFTSVALNRRVQNIPHLRRKVERVIALAGFAPMSHDGRALLHILETFPRDELFQMDEGRLFETAIGVLHLRERPHARAFLRPDKFGRFVSALVYVPRDLYDSSLRNRIEAILCEAYDGTVSARYAQLSDDVLARWHFIIRTAPGSSPATDPDAVNARIAQVARGWRDHLKEIAITRWGEERGLMLLERYVGGFTPAYRDIFTPEIAATDMEKLEAAAGPDHVQHHFYRLPQDRGGALRLKIYHPARVIPLSDVMPILECLGLRVIEEFAYEIPYGDLDRPSAYIHDFYLTEPRDTEIALAEVKPRLEDLLARIWAGETESDGQNALVLLAGLDWRQVEILRAYGKYLRQLGLSYSEDYLRASLADHPAIARLLIQLFTARFDPAMDDGKREPQTADIQARIQEALATVASPDQDAILRAFRNAILATLRCNAYQRDADGRFRPALALKVGSRDLKEAPPPRPFAEIFVYAPRVEGVHLRFGPVARGGLRWSDRPEDFRTEVLGLVKAQQVKNAVIVPEGAKGGFYPKRLPRDGAREAIMAEGVASYETFIAALLDVTDNIVGGTVVPPPGVVRHDADDPYLVVAADKGTASFSDRANAIAEAREFWLGDAFASGGSHGYDHKGMAITARGAWVSAERHFRERGIDLGEAEISVVGIGDMSGDVFGNGMLRSDRIRLKAAFDHRHIFVDPDPDPARSFAERQRLFALPRSSWADYDASLISAGGGVFERKAKAVAVTPEMREVLAIEDAELTPNQLIRAILKAPVDLLWIGGIGTFVKGPGESDRDVGDRTNDAVRVNGNELRCRVVGEGGNLGFTQRGRIAFAHGGGAINTDATDNSAGVDCSDREVNIKILLNALVRDGEIDRTERDRLLGEMTEDVAALVLRDNYLQTLSITLEHAASTAGLATHGRLISHLETAAHLDRALEFLPSADDLAERGARGETLTRPELAILMSYAKMALKRAIVASDLADDPHLSAELAAAFPPQLGARFGSAVAQHSLRREIIATAVANELVNRLGSSFCLTVIEQTGAGLAEIARAFVAVRDLFHFPDLWSQIDGLDNKAPAAVQTELHGDMITFARRFVIWALRRHGEARRIVDIIDPLRPGITALIATPLAILGDFQVAQVQQKMAGYMAEGVPEALAARIAALAQHAPSGDVVEVAAAVGRPVEDVGAAYYYLGNVTGLNWLKSAIPELPAADHWDRLAGAAMVDDLLELQRALAEDVLGRAPRNLGGLNAAETWVEGNGATLQRLQDLMTELRSGPLNHAKLGYASRHARRLLSLA